MLLLVHLPEDVWRVVETLGAVPVMGMLALTGRRVTLVANGIAEQMAATVPLAVMVTMEAGSEGEKAGALYTGCTDQQCDFSIRVSVVRFQLTAHRA